jgi:hypothetical protein
MTEYDELAKRVAALEQELAEAKKSLEASKPKEPFVPKKPWQPIDWTEGMRLPADAAQAMARVVPDVKGQGFNAHAHAQTKVSQPGGFGPVDWRDREARKVKSDDRRKVEPAADHRSPQTRIFDAMVDAMVGGPNDTSKLR